MARIYVGNIPWALSERELRDFFAVEVGVEKVEIVRERESGRSCGFAFIDVASDDDAARAIAQFNDAELMGRPLRVNHATPKPKPHRGFDRVNGRDRDGNREWRRRDY